MMPFNTWADAIATFKAYSYLGEFFKTFKLYFHNLSRSTNVDSIDIYKHHNNIHIISGYHEDTLHINI